MRIVFWLNGVSIHWSSLVRALAIRDGLDITFVAERGLTEEQKKIGKFMPDYGSAALVVSPSSDVINQLVFEKPEESIHIFCGYTYYPMVTKALKLCCKTKATIGVFSEPNDKTGIKGQIRRLSRFVDILRFGKRVDFMLATGSLGKRWWTSCGFDPERIFNFQYFIESPTIEREEVSSAESKAYKIIYVGQLIPRKGLDYLIAACADLRNYEWSLDIIGSGMWESHIRSLVESSGMSDRVSIHPALKNQEAVKAMASADLLVLPSRFDGWGAVVSEAIIVGTPVVCSDNCGAADLIQDDLLGAVCKVGSVNDLREKIEARVKRGRKTTKERNAISLYAESISGKSASDYLLRIIKDHKQGSSTLTPPWYTAAKQIASTFGAREKVS